MAQREHFLALPLMPHRFQLESVIFLIEFILSRFLLRWALGKVDVVHRNRGDGVGLHKPDGTLLVFAVDLGIVFGKKPHTRDVDLPLIPVVELDQDILSLSEHLLDGSRMQEAEFAAPEDADSSAGRGVATRLRLDLENRLGEELLGRVDVGLVTALPVHTHL